jgi:DNA-directed RNA polymerase subunit RPC12/RpoP
MAEEDDLVGTLLGGGFKLAPVPEATTSYGCVKCGDPHAETVNGWCIKCAVKTAPIRRAPHTEEPSDDA